MSASLDDVPWPVSTPRLRLRRATPADAAATFAYRSRPEVAEWLTSLPTDPTAWAERYGTPEVRDVTVILERDGVVVGDTMLRIKDGWSQQEVADRAVGVEAELGWVVHPDHQGRGYATEAVLGLLGICFDTLQLRRVTAGCFVENAPSWRLMERLGMRREYASRRDGLHRTRGWLDGYEYAALAEDWPAIRARSTAS